MGRSMDTRDPSLRIAFDENELIVDNFAGGGGASTGIEWALGRSPDIAINHSPEALACHEANHPETRHYCESVWDIDPIEVCGGRPVGLAWFSPDCFPKGTLILTREGYRPIEEIAVGDEVLTHLRRWRRVTHTMQTERPLVRIKGHGHPGLRVSKEHPFYVRLRNDVWNNARRRSERTWGDAQWCEARDIKRGHYWASPFEFPELSIPSIPVYRKRETSISETLIWIAGRYIADGYLRLTDDRADVTLSCGFDKADELRERLSFQPRMGLRSGSDEMSWYEREVGSTRQFSTSHRGLVEWLGAHFGAGSENKTIPGWALGMSEEYRKALLDGYLSGDGWKSKCDGQIIEANTVSKRLAFGLKALAASLGKSPAIHFDGRPNNVIQGRKVNAKPVWKVVWRDNLNARHRQTFHESGMLWAPIRENVDERTRETVFNLSVEEDESYVAEGIVVHNCTHFSRAKGGQPVSPRVRGLAWIVTRWARAVKPRIIILENVEEFETWGPISIDGKPCPDRRGKTFRAWLGQLRGLGYEVEWRSLVAADYGAPTTRKRLFLVARRDGIPIVWPEPTHGDPLLNQPYRTAAEVIDWSLDCPSIFTRKRPLADATLRRIAVGVRRYVIEAEGHHLVDAAAHTLIQTGYGERPGQSPRALDLDKPLGTVVAGGSKHALISATLVKYYGQGGGQSVDEPLHTITTKHRFGLVQVALAKASSSHAMRVRALLAEHGGWNRPEGAALVEIEGEQYIIADIGMRMLRSHELAAAQGFPEDYVLDAELNGKPLSETKRIALIGNSVCPHVAEALVRGQVAAGERREAA